MSKQKSGGKNFVIGAFVIAIAHILVKVIGAGYKIPLDRFLLQTEGMGVYSASYTIYNWLFVISTAGVPVAISKMVAEATAKNNYLEARRIFNISRLLLVVVGIISFLVLFFFAQGFSNLIGAPSAYLTMMCMSPSLFFVALTSSYRGFYQGRQNMLPTAISEVLEALCKLIFGLILAYYALKLTGEFHVASAGAITGVTIGSVLGCIFLILYHQINKRNLPDTNQEEQLPSFFSILKKLVKISIPITIGVSVFTLTSLIDTAMVLNQLSKLGFDEETRLSMYGYLNRAITMFNLPPTIISAIAISIVPAVAAALAVGNKKGAGNNAKSAIRITILVAVPCAAGLSALAQPIFRLLYADGNYAFLLNIMGIAVLFVTLVQTTNAILQAYGRVWTPVFHMLMGGIVKVLVNLILVSRPEININGAPIGTLCCYATVMILNIIALYRVGNIRFEFSYFILKPLLCGLATAGSAMVVYRFAYPTIGNFAATVLSITAGAFCYLAALLLLKALSKEDLRLIPKGNKIIEILERHRFL